MNHNNSNNTMYRYITSYSVKMAGSVNAP